MSKATELRLLRYGRSIDAPINYRHRTGDSESGGNMLDLYAQAESAEDVYFGNADERARELFVKGFRVYLKKVFTEQEREFLGRLLAGKESAYKIGRSLGVEHFAFLQGIQRKAFKNVKPLDKLTKMTGWSGAEEFTQTIYERLEQLSAGFALNDIIPQNAKIESFRKKFNEWYKKYYYANHEKMILQKAEYRKNNREKILEQKAKYYAKNREKFLEKKAEYRKKNREKILEQKTEYYAKNREKILEKKAGYYAKNREKILEKKAKDRKNNLEKHLERELKYRAANREKERLRSAKNRARKKAEKLAAIEAARADQNASTGGNE